MINSILVADVWLENLLFSVRTPLGLQVFESITFFGDAITIIGIAGIIGLFLFFSKSTRPYLAGLIITLCGAVASEYVLKELVGRVRPGGLIPAIVETSPSFPSGHATASMALYGFIAFILCRWYPQHRRMVIAIATIIILAIGFSRLYLGVHFPSDVIAGYILGWLWLLVGVKIINRISASSQCI
ncbi:MAG: phosphatase PAP2 family protein [Minisyncoccia bacterium]